MAVTSNASYTQAVDLYIARHNDWLDDTHTPLVTNLYGIATQLDRRVSAGLCTEFRQTFNSLNALAPVKTQQSKPEVGSDEAFLAAIGIK